MRIDRNSLLKAGTGAAAVAGLLLLLSLTPLSDTFVGYLLLAALIFVPVGGGMAYGYFAPGKENMAQSIIGGAIVGLIAGIILGIAFGINRLTINWINASFLAGLAGGLAVSVLMGGILGAFGLILGALGGIVWKLWQR